MAHSRIPSSSLPGSEETTTTLHLGGCTRIDELDAAPGDTVQQYELIRSLGRGGMGQVWVISDERRSTTARIWPHVREPVGRDAQTLWRATTYCMPAAMRQRLLGTGDGVAETEYQQCLDRVEAASHPAARSRSRAE